MTWPLWILLGVGVVGIWVAVAVTAGSLFGRRHPEPGSPEQPSDGEGPLSPQHDPEHERSG